MNQILIREIGQICENVGLGVLATANPADRTIFVGELPETAVEGLFIIQAPSPPPESYIDTEYAIIDFWARSPYTDRPFDLLQRLYSHFNRAYDYDTANWHIYFSKALGTIMDVDRDQENGKLLRLSVQFTCRNLNNVS